MIKIYIIEFYKKHKPILVYYMLACLFSWPFFFLRDVHTDSWDKINLNYIIKTSLIMWGPGLSAIICSVIFRDRIKKTVTLFGTSLAKSLLFWGLPLLALTFLGIPSKGNLISHVLPLQIIFGSFVYTLGEELGWRGFLQDQLNHLPKWKRYILIGLMWEVWHFTTRTLSGSILARFFRPFIFSIQNIILSFLMGEAVNKSKSLIIAVTLHTWINLIFEAPHKNTYIVTLCSIPFWAFMIIYWDKFWITTAIKTKVDR